MSFFSKFLKGLGFEEEETFKKTEKIKEKKKKEDKRVLASYDLNKFETDLKNNDKENEIVNNEINSKSVEKQDNLQFELVNVSSQIEVQTVVNRIKNGEKILINISSLDNNDKIRSLDFLSGAVFALNLNMQKVDGSVYLIQ